MKLLLISDIHANITAFDAVMDHADKRYGKNLSIAHLGDAIDYGMRPNESMERLSALASRLIINMAGNHERAVLGLDMERFSSSRGAEACRYTRSILDPMWHAYINSTMISGIYGMAIEGKRILFVHGDLSDPSWGTMPVAEMTRDVYRRYDYVICGHTHIPFLKEEFYLDDSAKERRGKTKTTFINPGSVGQPRNHNPASQYAVLDFKTGTVHFNAVRYDIREEISQYKGEVHSFYAERLEIGI